MTAPEQPQGTYSPPPTSGPRLSRVASVGFALLSLAIALKIGFRWRNIEGDDNLIPLRYVRNLLEGNGWVYNVGERVNATTSALNTLLIAGASFMTGGDPVAAAALVFGFGLASAAFFTYLMVLPSGLVPAWFAGLFVLFINLLPAAVGLEMSAYLGLVTATIWAVSREHYRLGAGLLGLVFLQRPDGLLLWVLVAAWFAWRHRREFPGKFPLLAQCATITLGVALPWVIFSKLYFGSVLPNTVGVKIAQGEAGAWGSGWIYLAGITRWLPTLATHPDRWFDWPVYALLAIVGATCALCFSRQHLPVLAWTTGFTAAYVILNVPAYHWYYNPLHFGILYMTGVAFEHAWRWGSHPKLRAARIGLRSALVIAGLVLLQPLRPELFSEVRPQWPHYRAAAQWFRENTPPDCSIACAEIGVVGYHVGSRKIVDMSGLVTPGGAGQIAAGNYDWWYEPNLPDYILAHAAPWPQERVIRTSADFASRYRLVHTVEGFPQGILRIYKRDH